MNTVSDPVSVCLVERNISVPDYFSVPFQDVLDSKKIIYIYIISYPITFYTKKKNINVIFSYIYKICYFKINLINSFKILLF